MGAKMVANADGQRGNQQKDYGKTLAVLLYRRHDSTILTNLEVIRRTLWAIANRLATANVRYGVAFNRAFFL